MAERQPIKSPVEFRSDYHQHPLQAVFNNILFEFDWRDVGEMVPVEGGLRYQAAWIAFVNLGDDPTKGQNPDLGPAIAYDMAPLLVEQEPDVVISPYSSKSLQMAERAVQLASEELGKDISLVIFAGDTKEQNVRDKVGEDGLILPYKPVTSKVTKYMGASREQLDQIAGTRRKILIDDVYTTGATLNTATRLISTGMQMEIPDGEIPIVVAVYEQPYVDKIKTSERPPYVTALVENPAYIYSPRIPRSVILSP